MAVATTGHRNQATEIGQIQIRERPRRSHNQSPALGLLTRARSRIPNLRSRNRATRQLSQRRIPAPPSLAPVQRHGRSRINLNRNPRSLNQATRRLSPRRILAHHAPRHGRSPITPRSQNLRNLSRNHNLSRRRPSLRPRPSRGSSARRPNPNRRRNPSRHRNRNRRQSLNNRVSQSEFENDEVVLGIRGHSRP